MNAHHQSCLDGVDVEFPRVDIHAAIRRCTSTILYHLNQRTAGSFGGTARAARSLRVEEVLIVQLTEPQCTNFIGDTELVEILTVAHTPDGISGTKLGEIKLDQAEASSQCPQTQTWITMYSRQLLVGCCALEAKTNRTIGALVKVLQQRHGDMFCLHVRHPAVGGGVYLSRFV